MLRTSKCENVSVQIRKNLKESTISCGKRYFLLLLLKKGKTETEEAKGGAEVQVEPRKEVKGKVKSKLLSVTFPRRRKRILENTRLQMKGLFHSTW